MPLQKIAIIGAGIAGLACADRLAADGHKVTLFDKARGPGGRMSARRIATELGEASFDHGAQYFTARDADFAALVAQWHDLGLVARWTDAAPDAWVGQPAMNAPVKHMAAAHEVRWSTRIDAIARDPGGWRLIGDGFVVQDYDQLMVALPAEQAALLLQGSDPIMAAKAAATPSAPCWSVMIAFAQRLPTETKTLRDAGAIGWAACNSSKPGRSGPEAWVIQASPTWSRAQLEADASWVITSLMGELAAQIGIAIPAPISAQAHRWRYARSGAQASGMFYNRALSLGVCGDWLIGPRIECGWRSGTMLGSAIAETLAGDARET